MRFAKFYLDKIIENTNTDDWLMRYFAGFQYLIMYEENLKNDRYHEKAYQIILGNIITLSQYQAKLINNYLEELKNISKTAKKEDKELLLIYEPLLLNIAVMYDIINYSPKIKSLFSVQYKFDSVLTSMAFFLS